MSLSFPNLVLPSSVGWDFAKRSKFSTIQQTPQSMRHPASATLQVGVIYELELTWEFLKNGTNLFTDDVSYIQSFFEACKGGYAWFTFDPSQFNLDTMAVAPGFTANRNGFFALGDGVTTSFPLWRSTGVFGGGIVTRCELIQNVTDMAGIYIGTTLISPSSYTLTNLGAPPQGGAWVTFTTPPTAGAALSWAGSYSYLCKFAEDVLDMNEFMYQFWELKSLKLETINL